MTQKDHILQELNSLDSSLAGQEPGNIFQVPVGYFDALAGTIMTRIKAMEAGTASEELNILSPLLAAMSKQTPYSVPVGYFHGLEESISYAMQTGDGQDLETISPLLNGLKKQNPYTVPEGYFDTLTATAATTSAKPVEKAKVISMSPVRWMRYAAAAMVIGIVSVSSFFLLNKKKSIDPDTASYAWVEKNMKQVSTDDINKFLELTDETTLVASKDATQEEIKIKELLKDVSDKEIQDFLSDTGLDELEEDDILN